MAKAGRKPNPNKKPTEKKAPLTRAEMIEKLRQGLSATEVKEAEAMSKDVAKKGLLHLAYLLSKDVGGRVRMGLPKRDAETYETLKAINVDTAEIWKAKRLSDIAEKRAAKQEA